MKPPKHGASRTPQDWQVPKPLQDVASMHGYKVTDQEGILGLYDHPTKGTLIMHHDGSWHHTSASGQISEGADAASLSDHLSKA
ncbi:MAG TPA: hypothetical protein VKV95_14520 [Terriglobia bacterium]|nr:hypothetical protein [Terriglobia bacterium]